MYVFMFVERFKSVTLFTLAKETTSRLTKSLMMMKRQVLCLPCAGLHTSSARGLDRNRRNLHLRVRLPAELAGHRLMLPVLEASHFSSLFGFI